MKKIYLILIALFSLMVSVFAQTTLISPTGDGGFETGGTMAANGWTAVNSVQSFFVGTSGVTDPSAGTNLAYTSTTSGSWTPGIAASVAHIYKDVVVPPGENVITITLKYKTLAVDATWDILKVHVVPTSTTPVAAVQLTTGQIGANTDGTTSYATYTFVGAVAAGSQRVVISFKTDASSPNGAAAVDEISVVSSVPVVISSTAIGGLWSSSATWAGGVVPTAIDKAIIADGASVTVDQLVNVRDLTIGGGTSGILQWNAGANALTVTGNVLVNSGANLNMFLAAASHGGVTVNVGGNFTNNGTVHAAMAASIINFNSTTSSTPSNLDGSGIFVGGIIGQLVNASTGGVTINTSQNITTRAIAHTAGPLNTNGKLSLDNTATIFGTSYNQKIYNVVVTVMGTGYNSATPPTITIAAPSSGVTATATPNIDDATGTLRSITITNVGDGYAANPVVTISGGTGSGATAIAVNNRFSSGLTTASIQKSGAATITGGINIRSEQAVGAVASSTVLGVGYTSAPSIGFGLPFGYQNLVTAGGSGYTSLPTITVSGGTFLTGVTNPTFTVVVAQGRVVSVIAAGGGTFWTSPPTLTVTGGGGSGATAAYPAGCLATATASITNGAVSSYTLTNGGSGYTAAPTVSLVGGGFSTAATAFSAVPLYNLTLSYFAPATVNSPHTETGVMPVNRRINVLSVTNAVSGSAFTGDVEIYAAAPLALTTSFLSFGSNTLFASHPTYAGVTGSLTNNISGNIRLSTPGGSLTRTFPFDAPLVAVLGTGSLATGSTVTSVTASRTAAPTGPVDNGATPTGTRAYQLVTNAGAVYGTSPTVQLNFNSNDALFSDQSTLYVAQATALTGPWVARSVISGSGALPATGSRTTATSAPGPIVPTGNDFYAWATTTPPPIVSVASGNWNTGSTWNTGVVPVCADNVIISNTHNVTVTTAGNVGNNVTINAGGTLTVSSGDVTAGCTLNNKSLTNNGTLTVSGGTLNVNGSILNSSASVFNQSGGNINVDGNAAGVIANSVASGTAILQFNQLNSGINLTGGTLTIVDPHAATTATNVIGVSNATAGTQTSTVNHTLRFGDGTSIDAGGNAGGFIVDNWTATSYLSFGNIIINGGSGTNRRVTSLYQLAAVGDVNITANSILSSGSSLVVGRNLTIDALGTFTGTTTGGLSMALVSSNTGSALTFGASNVPQNITNNGTMNNLAVSPTANLITFSVQNSNAAGVTLNSPLTVSGTLSMTAGRINTSATNLLTLGYNATNVGTFSYTAGQIVGPFKRWISAATGSRIFPMGDGLNLKIATLNFTTAPTTAGSLTASWSTVAPNFPNASPLMEGALIVDKASKQGSWFIDAADGLAGGTYSATFTANGSTDVIDFAKTVLIKRPSGGGDWTLDGTHVTSTGTNAAPILNRTGMTGFSEFAVGGEANIVLPLNLIYFTASKQADGNKLDWKVTCIGSPSVVLTLERSADSRTFSSIFNISASSVRCETPFDFKDLTPRAGVNYYRLKMVDIDGRVTYSPVVAIINSVKGLEIVNVYPNPVRDIATLDIVSAKQDNIELKVTDVFGRIVLTRKVNINSGSTKLPLNMTNLSAGTYIVTITAQGEAIKTARIIKD